MMQGGDGNNAISGGMASSETIMVPDKMVGLIIGRGGEQITRLQAESGCKIQMAQDSAGMQERQCTLTGPPSAIAAAKASIDRIIANEGSGPQRGPPGMGGPQGGGGGFFEMVVQGHKVGLIIGKGGETIKHLQESTGAKIVIIQETADFANEKPLRITGSPDSVERAKNMVTEILNQNDDRDMGFAGRDGGGRGRGRGRGIPRGAGNFMARGRGGRGGYGENGGGRPDYGSQQHQDYVSIPASKCGLVIGKGGETIKNINQMTGAYCEVDKNAPPDAREKNFIIRGSVEAVERAKAMILEKLGMQGGPGGGGGYGGGSGPGGGYGGSWGGQYQAPGGYQQDSGVNVNPQTGQPDYSAQWIEYYRSMGMTREAEVIEQQAARAAPVQATPQAAPAAANGAGAADYSAQWAEYYRSIGKHKEAEAIEAQMKQKAPGPQGYGAPSAQYPAGGYYGGTQAPASAYPGYQGYAGYGHPAGAES